MRYKKVIEDYASGAIDRNDWVLIIDNDGGYWEYSGISQDENHIEAMRDEMVGKYGAPNGYEDIVDILQAAGVESDWC